MHFMRPSDWSLSSSAFSGRKCRTKSFVVASAVIFSLAACSSSPQSTAGSQSKAATVSPLMEAIGLAGDEFASFESGLLSQHEDHMAECMSKAGFEYVKQPPLQVNNVVDKDSILATVSETGYGISFNSDEFTFPEDDPQSRLFYYSITTKQSDAAQTAYDRAVSQNSEYYNSLSEEDQAAYDQARYGSAESGGYELDEDGNLIESQDPDDFNLGCESSQSDNIVDPAEDVLGSDEFADIVEEIVDFYGSVETSEAVNDLYDEWSQCFADAVDQTFSTPAEASAAIYDDFEALFEPDEMLDEEDDEQALDDFLLNLDESDGDVESFDEESLENDDSLDEDPLELELGEDTLAEEDSGFEDDAEEAHEITSFAQELGVDEATLNELNAREIFWAKADVNCRFDVDYFDKIQQAQLVLERDFVKSHKADLEKLHAAIQQARQN